MEEYQKPEMEIIIFSNEDIIISSPMETVNNNNGALPIDCSIYTTKGGCVLYGKE